MKNFVVWAILLFTTTFFGACDMPQNLPIRFYLDRMVSNEEYLAALAAANQWNKQAGSLLDPPQKTIIEIVDRYTNTDIDKEDVDLDGVHVVYIPTIIPKKIRDSPDVTKTSLSVYWSDPKSFWTGSEDIYIFRSRIEKFWGENKDRYHSKETWFKNVVYRILLHEFGHALGIWNHIDDPDAVMQASYHDEPRVLTKEDLKQFCKIYSCK